MTDNSLSDWWEELLQVHEFIHYHEHATALTCREVDFLVEALALQGGETILDLGCGGGRHSLELARRGITMVGLDVAASVLKHARATASSEALAVEFVQADMRMLSEDARFDAVLMMNSSFGLFDDAANAAMLATCARALVPAGRLVLQCINPYQIESYLRDMRSAWYALGEGVVLREAAFDPRHAMLQLGFRYLNANQGLDVHHPGDHVRLYGFPELSNLLHSAGLRPLSLFADAALPPEPFAETSQWQVVVARKEREVVSVDAESPL
ncbi:MAG: class I SAM-dependent methyltransferase [Candidatus Viridilinea halotolerans]|uniref:Class I SAM-dependent methyltransferase n=1 Tax=Candidatus Viridilinea halotolerans TaxID=2491704 RepID=A0A426TVE7_9CHLR|nr:MAG: class I SAM-dependent methyltransferase [Candidatus Viridilinea halotolerans]